MRIVSGIINADELRVNAGWMILVTESGAEVSINLEDLQAGMVQVSTTKSRTATKIKLGRDPMKTIEKAIGEKFNLEDDNVRKFITMLPCDVTRILK